MHHILITGGTGVMGSVLVKKLTAAGNRVRVLTLPNDPGAARAKELGADVRFGNIADAASLSGICDGIDTVYHLAAIIIAFDDALYEKINTGGTANIAAEAKKAGVKRFIHVSSASVLYPKPTPYSSSKRKCEEIVRQSGMQWTIVRPTLVYDRGKGGQEFDILLDYLRKFPVVPFIGSGKSLKRPVFVDDIIDGLFALCDNPNAAGKIYNFSGAEAISIFDFCRLCLKLMGTPGKPAVKIPVWLCLLLAWGMKLVMKRPPLRWPVIAGITQDANLHPAEAQRDLGYNPIKVTEKLPECFPRKT
jgi:NADH dehydrogenase